MTQLPNALLAIQLNNQLLIHRQLNIFTLGQRKHSRRIRVAIHFQPVGQRTVAGKFLSQFEHGELLALLANGNLLARTHFIGRNVDLAIVHGHVSVPHQLPRLPPRLRKAQPEHHVVETPLQLLQQQLAGYAPRACGFFEVVAELAFQREVDALGFLLLAQLQPVANNLGLAVLPMLSGSEVALLDGALIAKTLCAFEEQLHALTAAQTANCIGIACQIVLLLDDRFTGLASPFVPDENQWSVAGHQWPETAFDLTGHWSLTTGHCSYTLLLLGGRHPLCGIGVRSRIDRTSIPDDASARTADSRPEPGPLTRTSTLRTP